MPAYSRPFYQSSRLRHFAAGAGAVLLLFLLGSASRVGIGPMATDEEVTVAVDVRDVPCDEPYEDRVEVIPDTLDGRVRISVVVRNRDCCCCGVEGGSNLGLLRRPSSRTERQAPPPEPAPEVLSMREDAEPVTTFMYPERAEPPSPFGPFARMGDGPVASGPPMIDRARIPWWIALAAAPVVFLGGEEDRPPGGVCEDDEVGKNSGPPRTGCWPKRDSRSTRAGLL